MESGGAFVNMVFDVLQKQQSTIINLRSEVLRAREELGSTRSEFGSTTAALAKELGELRSRVKKAENSSMSVEERQHSEEESDSDAESCDACVLLEEDESTPQMLSETLEQLEDPPLSVEVQRKGVGWNSTFRILRFRDKWQARKATALLEEMATRRESLASAPRPAMDEDIVEEPLARRRVDLVVEEAPEARSKKKKKKSGVIFEDAEHSVLIRHARDRKTVLGLLDLLQILEPELAASPLDDWGLYEFLFPDKLKAVTAIHLIDGADFGGSRIEASLLGSSARRIQLTNDLQRLLPKGDLRYRTLIFTSLPANATESGLRAVVCPGALEASVLKQASGTRGEFSVGKAVFATEKDARQAAEEAHSVKLQGSSVSAKVLDVPLTDILKKRLEALEEEVYHGTKNVVSRTATNSEAIVILEESVEHIESQFTKTREKHESRIDALWNNMAQLTEVKLVVAKADSRLNRLDKNLKSLKGGGNLEEAIDKATDNVLAELEKLSILVPAPSGGPNGRGSAFVVSDEIFAAANVHQDLLKVKSNLDELKKATDSRLTEDDLRQICAKAADSFFSDDALSSPLSALVLKIREDLRAQTNLKADKSALLACETAFQARLEKRLEEVASDERHETTLSVNVVAKGLESAKARIDDTERDFSLLTKRVDALRIDPLRATLSRVENDLEDVTFKLTAQVDRLGVDLSSLAADNDDKPNTQKVRTIVDTLAEDLRFSMKTQASDVFGAMDRFSKDVSAKLSIRDKDILAIITRQARDLANASRSPDDDTLMVGALPYRCLGCNKPKDHVHGTHADKVVHSGLNPIPATHTASHHRPETTFQAAYAASGRGGALRPLRPQATPGIPRDN